MPMWRKSVEKVAGELEAKLHDKAWLEAAGTAARKLAEKEFDRDMLGQQLLAVLESVGRGHPESAASIAPGTY